MKHGKRTIVVTCACMAAVVGLAGPVAGDWMPGDPAKWVQMPDPFGWDVKVTEPHVIADDWFSGTAGPVTDLHFWGSWKGDNVGTIAAIWISIHADIPDPDGPGPLFSMPGALLYSAHFVPGEFIINQVGKGDQGWFDPKTNEVLRNDHTGIYQVNMENIIDPFMQAPDTIYWLDIQVALADPQPGVDFGWKTSLDFFQDDAVWAQRVAPGETPAWAELFDPQTGESLDMAFVIGIPAPGTLAVLALAGLVGIRRRRRS